MKLLVLGGLQLSEGDYREPQPLLLLCYLSLTGKSHRGELAELFWIGSSEARRRRKSLSEALRKLRHLPGNPVIDVDSAHVTTRVRTDYHDVTQALDSGYLEEALQLYSGVFLADVEYSHRLRLGEELREWIIGTREKLQVCLSGAALKLAEQQAQRGHFGEGARLALKAEELSPAVSYFTPKEYQRLHTLLLAGGLVREAAEIATVAHDLYEGLPLFATQREARDLLTFQYTSPLTNHAQLEPHPGWRALQLLSRVGTDEGFENLEQLRKASSAYRGEAVEHFRRGAFDRVQQLLEPFWRQEVLLAGGEHDSEMAFLLAYAYERDGKFRRGLEVINELGDEFLTSDALALRAALLLRVGEYEAAEVLIGELEPSLRPDSWASAQVLNVRGNLAFARKRYREALEHFQKAELKWRFLDGNRRVGELTNIGIVYDWMGEDELPAANAAFERALKVADEVKANSIEKLRVLYNWSVCLVEHGRVGEALGKEIEADGLLSVMREGGEYVPEAYQEHHLISIGITLQEQGETAEARVVLERACGLAAMGGNLALQGIALCHLGELKGEEAEVRYGLELLEYSGSTKDIGEYRERFERFLGKS